ncbi:ketose-bisphosphate aldolase [Patescibacteria group bacterium]
MLVNSRKILKNALDGKYAVGHFNTSNLEETQAIISGAAEMRSPVIVGTSESAIDYAGIDNIVDIVQNMAEKADIPIVLHLDHGKNFEIVKRAFDAGYTSLMFDGSKLPFEENIKITKKVVNLARGRDVSVEGELGTMLENIKDKDNSEEYLTDPNQAAEFVRVTDIDALAVAIGTAHGLPQVQEKIDFERIKEISEKVKIPLVLHGSSNSTIGDFRKAIKMGIAKVNIDTELRQAFTEGVRGELRDEDLYNIREFLAEGRAEVKERVKKLIKVFGSEHKA